ncbi:uncharacterized protein TRAVEDRAFT_127777 [Trametes versicolor FP-101664 SS1]|uniref:uncharacterized protein n=1 Tax=Trametes versicolor (strain FP-101664) TaxID=717944 RepID=UPI0004622AE7|nr:uncharacterized protein TRAVEDRAFT_127777 [Trametes versicolor FP-101664 SS1]EIW56895.1 hypothetical protein TRAVEDRAFT_127777 [Trametes versicolor FP-101664 SS1]
MSEPASSSNKRQRTDSDATGPEKNGPNLIKRDDEFWFEDGNIVLVARDIEFRVYKGILAKHSPVFGDMFSLPPGPSSEGTTAAADICPVVHLSDSPEDFRHVLRVYISFAADKPSFDAVSRAFAVARMAHKYQMHDMLALVVKYLRRSFPADFRQWDASPFSCIPSSDEAVLAIGAVNLARLIDEPSLLPTTLFVCCSLKAADLLKGYTREDGSAEHLALEDIAGLLDARGRLTEKTLILAARIFALRVSKKCAAPDTCREALEMMLEGVGRYAEMFAGPNVLTSWLEAYGMFADLCCERCRVMLRERDEKERRAVWDELPEIMGVQVANWVQDEP